MKTVRHILASSGVLLSAVALTSCVEPEVTTDASAPDAAADAAQQATLSERLERVPLAQFRGTVDLDNEEFSLELIDPAEWASDYIPEDAALRDVEQAVWCPVRVTEGRPFTVGLETVDGSIGFGLAACDVAGFPYDSLGVFCFEAELTNFYPSTLRTPLAELTKISPDSGYTAYNASSSLGAFGVDTSTLRGPLPPSDVLGGPFGWSDLPAGASDTVKWAFTNEGGAFSFAGAIVADIAEDCTNTIDDNCDFIVNDGCGIFADGDACYDDSDCSSGFCDGPTNAVPGVCAVGGCTDPGANNYDAAAQGDDGSCLYDVTFNVDMRCAGDIIGPNDGVFIQGQWTNWVYAAEQLTEGTDDFGDPSNIWSGSLESGVGVTEFKVSVAPADWSTGGWSATNEDLTGASCAVDSAGGGNYNRTVDVQGDVTVDVVYASCGRCFEILSTGDIGGGDVSVSASNVGRFAPPFMSVGSMGAFDGGNIASAFIPYQLPALNPGEFISTASLRVAMYQALGSNAGAAPFGADLYALDVRATSAATTADFYAGATHDAVATLIADDFVQPQAHAPSPPNHPVFQSDDAAIASFLQSNWVDEEFATFRISPADDGTSLVGDNFFSFFTSQEAPANRPRLFVGTDISGSPGCIDVGANNYDPSAGYDDGSCLYDVTFCADMGCPDQLNGSPTFTNVNLTGPSFSWCGDCVPLTDMGAGQWCTTIELPAGPFEYKYNTDTFADQEQLVDDVQAGRTCAPVTDGNTYANRQVTVGAGLSLNDVYGSCNACPQGTNLDLLPSSDDGRIHTNGGLTIDRLTDTTVGVGEFFAPGGANMILAFPLPGRDVGGEVYAAELELQIAAVHNQGAAVMNIDLYGRVASGSVPNVDWTTADYYQGANDTGGAWTLIEDDFLNESDDAAVGASYSSAAGSAALGALLEAAYNGGAVEGDVLLLRLSPDVDPIPSGYDAWDIYTSEAGAAGPRLHVDHVGLSYGTPQVPGCNDNSANNYDPAATQDDGSCTYDVTFVLNGACPDHIAPPASVGLYSIASSNWGWDPNAILGDMTPTGNPDEYAVTLSLAQGVFVYTIYAFEDGAPGTRGTPAKEDLIDDMAGGATCAPATDYVNYANREELIAGPTTVNLVYGECGTTCPGPDLSASYPIAATEDDMIHNRYGTGFQVGDPALTEKAIVGEYYNGQPSMYVMSFAMPDLADDEFITGASLRLDIAAQNDNDGVPGYPFNGDLWGLPFAASGTITVGDHYFVGANDPNAILAGADVLNVNSHPDPYTLTNAGMVTYLNSERGDGSEGNFVFLRINPDVAPLPPGWNNWEFFRSTAPGALPTELTIDTDRCPAGELVDCSGNCVAFDAAVNPTDAVCDNGASGLNLNCPLWGNDGGACTGICNVGETLACDGTTCVADTTANGTCDAALNCTDTAYDGFDCLNVGQGACAAGEIEGCDGSCNDPATLAAQNGDAICQPALDCSEFAFDGGDCCTGGTITDCDGNTICDNAVTSGDGVCQSIRGGGQGNLLCSTHGFEGGDCQGPCAADEIPTCSLFGNAPYTTYGCVAATSATGQLGDGVCDADFSCGYYAQDGGDCANGAQATCYGQGQLADCDDNCFAYAGLNFWGDAACDDGDFGPPNFECGDWSFDYNPFDDPTQSGSADCTVNLLSNGDFEAGLTDWATHPGGGFSGTNTTGSTYYSSANLFTAQQGTQSGKLYDDPGVTEANLFQEFNFTGFDPAGDSYLLTGYVLTAAEEPFGGTNSVVAGMKWFDQGYGFFGWTNIVIADANTAQNTWQPFSVCGTFPAGANKVQAGFAYLGSDNYGTAWFDDVVFSPVASCPTPVHAEVNNRTEGANNYDVIQVSGADSTANAGGTPSTDLRTAYGFTPDGGAGNDPSYAGAAWPYVVLPEGGTITQTGDVTASVSNRYVPGVGRVLTIGGNPVYQYTGDADATGMTGAFVTNWFAFNADGSAVVEGVTQVFGCTDAAANNFDAAATDDDGTCTYDLTFEVDMGCYQVPGAFIDNLGAIGFVNISGPFNSWCPDCMQLTDGDGDNVWTGTFSYAPGTALEFKFQRDFWAAQENLIDDMQGGASCAPVTNFAGYANRTHTTAAAPETLSLVYGHCDAACPTYGVDFCNVQFPTTISDTAGAMVDVFGQLYIAGLTDGGVNDIQARPDNVVAEFGFGAPGADASTFTWASASDNIWTGNNYEFIYSWTLPGVGTYDYAYRISGDGGTTWEYCGPADHGNDPITVSRGSATSL